MRTAIRVVLLVVAVLLAVWLLFTVVFPLVDDRLLNPAVSALPPR
ncbi:hypothetical protein BH23ACT9_BH23ACT9_17880 [soil metagenome]